jgi:ClpX C4-type zinc finger
VGSTAGPQTVIATCSKPNTQVGTLIAGLGVFICDQCVDECVTVIADRSASVPRIAPWEADLALKDVLANLGPVAEACSQADQNLTSWVTKARSLGATWSQIGDALNCSRQAVWERFSVPGVAHS